MHLYQNIYNLRTKTISKDNVHIFQKNKSTLILQSANSYLFLLYYSPWNIWHWKSKVIRKLIIPNLKEDMSCSQGSMIPKTSKCKRYREKEQTTSQSSSTQHYIPSLKAKQTDKNYHNDSIQTCSSDRSLKRQAPSSLHNHKVQLCKNYISKGYCPYQNRCRFAHGVEQLRARDADQNSQLYRTRKCKVFFEKGECRFGQRCNFRHENRTVSEIMQISLEGANYQLRSAFPEVFMNIKMNKGSSSRLMTLLNLDI